MAAEQGNAKAQFKLGNMYRKDDGVTQDYAEAVRWYELAAEQSTATAQLSLGSMYRFGMGVIQDNVYAHMWWNIAASRGDDNAAAHREMVAKEMTAEQITEAQRLARECARKEFKNC